MVPPAPTNANCDLPSGNKCDDDDDGGAYVSPALSWPARAAAACRTIDACALASWR